MMVLDVAGAVRLNFFMFNTNAVPEKADSATVKRKAALSSVLWSGFLTLIKIVAGLSSNSLGMLSEALHSAFDLIAAGITFFAVRISARPADDSHPFGHGKVEHLSALAETALLVLTCAWIVFEAIERLFFLAAPVRPSWWVFGVVIISLIVDVNRSAMLRRVAREHRSQAIEADALHFSSDIWSSAVVLLGLACVAVSNWLEPASVLRAVLVKADAVAALIVAGIVLGLSWQLARRSIAALMDGAKAQETELIRASLAEHAPAFQVRLLRVRESGDRYFVELTVDVPPFLRVDAAHDIQDMLEQLIRTALPGAESVIHMEPAKQAAQLDLYAVSNQLGALHDLSTHGLALVTLDDGLHVFVDIELDPDMPLTEAHARVSAYERDLAAQVGAVRVVSQLEPTRRLSLDLAESAGQPAVLEALQGAMTPDIGLYGCHDEETWGMGTMTALSFRCYTKAGATVAEAHRRASLLEDELRRRLPNLGHVTIHVEPEPEQAATGL